MGTENHLSVIIPIYNEEATLPELHRRLSATLDDLAVGSVEVIFVDDGSSDASARLLEEFHEKDNRFKVLQFSRNFGHHIAVTAGLDHSQGEIVILMDGDLQNRPEDIPALLQKIGEGYDVVSTIRKNRKDPLAKKTFSKLFVWLMGKVVEESISLESTSIFRALKRDVVDALGDLRERNRFVIGLIDWTGYKHTSIEVVHEKRFDGESKYSFYKQLRLALDAIFSFSTFPLQVASMLGFAITASSFAYGLYIVVRKLVWGFSVPGFASLTVSIFFMGGVQLIILGTVGAYIGRIYTEVKQRPLYIVKKKLAD